MTARNHVAIAQKYIDDVLAGNVDACIYVKQACERQRRDLKELEGYRFDEWRANRICKFIEFLPHIKGELEGQNIRLEPWQCFVLTTAFGWVHAEGPREGRRRFRICYTEVPRGNGKSAISSAVMLYMLAADGEGGAEIYSAATTRDQAGIVFNDARAMLRLRPNICAKLGITVSKHAIHVDASNSIFKALSSQTHSLDGKNVHAACLDELHAHKTRTTYDVLETALGKRQQSMLWNISTAGSDRSGICYEVRSYLTRVLSGAVVDNGFFGVIYTIDNGDDWTAESSWRKANPNWAVSVQPDMVAQLAAKAMQLSSATNNFLTKHLNVWVNADSAWMDMAAWQKCGDPSLSIEDFAHDDCIAGLDLASKVDIASRVIIFRRIVDDEPHFYLFARHYLPEAAVHSERNSQYVGWVRDGWLTATDGEVTDIDLIERDLLADAMQYRVNEVAYDPFQATQLCNRLMANGIQMVEVRPTVLNFSEPMKEMDALVRSGRLHHNNDPVMTWMVSNVVCHTDAKDNIYPRKERPENKIDGVVAAIMALARWTVADNAASIDDIIGNPITIRL